jgi:hypothetical protein
VSSEGDESRVVPPSDISRRGVKILIDLVSISRKGGTDKNLGTGGRSRRRGGGRKGRRPRQRVFDRIHIRCCLIFFFFFGRQISSAEPTAIGLSIKGDS